MQRETTIDRPIDKAIADWDFLDETIVAKFSMFRTIGQNVFGIRRRRGAAQRERGDGAHVLVVGLTEPLLRIHHVIMRMPGNGRDLSAAADGCDHVDARAGRERRREPGSLLIHVDVDVRPQPRPGHAQPITQAGPARLQLRDRLVHRGRVDLHATREVAEQGRQGGWEVNVGHGQMTATSTEAIAGRYPAISSHVSPSSALAKTWPVLVPK